MAYRLIQIVCIALMAAAIYAVNVVTDGIGHLLGDNFDAGFLVGMGFTILVYLLICWIDPSSRPRGTGQKQSPNDRTY